MFLHLLIYRFRDLVRTKYVIGWTLLFPLLLATAFYAGFGDLIRTENGSFDPIPVALVSESGEEGIFSQVVESLAEEDSSTGSDTDLDADSGTDAAAEADPDAGADTGSGTDAGSDRAAGNEAAGSASGPALRVTKASQEEAEVLLKAGKVSGIYTDRGFFQEPSLTVSGSGMDQTVLSEVLRVYLNDYTVSADLIKGALTGSSGASSDASADEAETSPSKDSVTVGRASKEQAISSLPGLLSRIRKALSALDELKSRDESMSRVSFREDPVSSGMQYFFSLLAMASLFSSWSATSFMKSLLADQSAAGLRFECSPAPRLTAAAASALAGILLQALSGFLVVLYIEYVLGLSFHIPLGYILLVTTLGGAVGVSFDMAVSTLTHGNEALNVAIPLTVTMTCSFLSGLMVGSMKQIIENAAPILNRLNPAAVLTDALYCAGTYGVGRQYWSDAASLAVMAALLLLFAGIRMRRQNYDHL